MALPLLETRAPTTTSGKADKLAIGLMAWLSSRVKCMGRSFTFTRMIAKGMRGPSTARAKMKTVSSGETRSRKSGAISTTPLTRAPPAAVGSGMGSMPSCARRAFTLAWMVRASSEPGGSTRARRSQYFRAME